MPGQSRAMLRTGVLQELVQPEPSWKQPKPGGGCLGHLRPSPVGTIQVGASLQLYLSFQSGMAGIKFMFFSGCRIIQRSG